MMRAAATLLLALLCTACLGTAEPSPSANPTPSPTADPTGQPTTDPTAVPTLPPEGVIDHPTGATDVVLRMERRGGFLWPGMSGDWPPLFTLYGDGTIIYDVPASGFAATNLRAGQMTEEQMSALLAYALGAGGLAGARDGLYPMDGLADATTTVFTLDAAGMRKRVSVYALGDWEEVNPDMAQRQAFLLLQTLLGDFLGQVEAGNATDLGPYVPEAYKVTLIADEFGDVQERPSPWPWDDLLPSDFERDQSGFGIRIVTTGQGQAVEGLPEADVGGVLVVGPDDLSYVIRLRPLLPDEID